MGTPDPAVPEAPASQNTGSEVKKGTGEWLAQQPHVNVQGRSLPNVHKIPDGATFYDGDDDGKCRVIRPDGTRCRATRTKAYGICSAHLGGGDALAASRAGVQARAKLKSRRMLLGVGPNRTANPRQIARLRALERAEELADALVDAPLDARELGAIERQLAVVRALDATFPLQAMTVEVELPTSQDEVGSMGWNEMQALAARLLEAD